MIIRSTGAREVVVWPSVAVLHDVRSDIVDLAALSISDGGQEHALPWRLRSELQIGWWSGSDQN